MSKQDERNCPYVNGGHSSVGCSSWLSHPDECKTCGWHPDEHKRRVAALRAGETKTFLNINMKAFDSEKNAFQMRELRYEQKDS